MKRYSSLIVTGSMSWDTIMDFPSRFMDFLAPEKLHQINVSFVVDNLEKQMGGTATNIAFAASEIKKVIYSVIPTNPPTRRGVEGSLDFARDDKQITIHILGGLGKDGSEHLSFFKKHKIDTRGIVVDKKIFSANGSVITDIKDNQIWGFYYGACERGKDVKFAQFVKKDSLMIISANHPRAFLAAQKYAVKNKVDYLYDAGMALTWITDGDLKQGVMNATYLIGNDYEIAMILKRIKMTEKELVKKGVIIITTLGDQGVRLECDVSSRPTLRFGGAWRDPSTSLGMTNINITIPACKVNKVVDPTGAGDGFRGGFMVALACGYDMMECLKVGNVVASFAIEKYGTLNYKISKNEFEKRLKLLSS